MITSSDRFYRVNRGDTGLRIAHAYGLTLDQLKAANPNLGDFVTLYRGQLVHIPVGVAEQVPPFYETP